MFKRILQLSIFALLAMGIVFGESTSVIGQNKVRLEPQLQAAPSDSKEKCLSNNGIWNDNRCYLAFNRRVTIRSYCKNSTKPYPTNVKSCSGINGIWRDGMCFIAFQASSRKKAKDGLDVAMREMTCEELDKAREECIKNGGTFWERDNDGFCFMPLKSDATQIK